MDQDSFNKLATRFAASYGQGDVKTIYDDIISKKALAPVHDDPSTAIALLQNYDLIGLETGRAAQALDIILGEIADKENPGDVLADNLTQHRINELLGHLDGGFSMGAYVANVENVLGAIRAALAMDARKPDDDRRPFHPIILSWAYRLKERPDYSEILQGAINRFTFKEWLLIAIWAAENHPLIDIDPEDATEPIPVARFAYFGIDESAFGPDRSFPLDMFFELQDLIEAYRQGEFALETVEDAILYDGEPPATAAEALSGEEELGLDLDGEGEEDFDIDDESGDLY
ncbi:MAG TPA: hypothetical protein VGK27_06965 [Candidatus Deferrimicrobiaceae bacterium]|jgi:hypothetical protein